MAEVAEGAVTRTESKQILGHSKKEWYAFLPALGSMTLIIFGGMHLNDCPAIPSLAAFCVTFGSLNILNAAIPFVFHVEKRKENGESPKSEKFASLVGLSLLICSVWGAAVTWPEVKRLGDSPGCDKNVYMPGFISCTICIVVVVFMFVGFLISTLVGKKAVAGTDVEMQNGTPGVPSGPAEHNTDDTNAA